MLFFEYVKRNRIFLGCVEYDLAKQYQTGARQEPEKGE